MKYCLIVTEGKETEIQLCSALFSALGYVESNTVTTGNRISGPVPFKVNVYTTASITVYVVKGPKNQIKQQIADFKLNQGQVDLGRYFGIFTPFAHAFLIYDVDYGLTSELMADYLNYNDSTNDFLMVLSNPCIESFADDQRLTFTGVPSDYKTKINKQCRPVRGGKSFLNYMKDNVLELLVMHIEHHTRLYSSLDSTEHLDLSYSRLASNIIVKSGDPNPLNTYHDIFSVLYAIISDIYDFTFKNDGLILLRNMLNGLITAKAHP